MSTICFILLCHRAPASVIAQARMLTAAGDCVVIHYDRNAKGFEQIRQALRHHPRVGFARRRRCGWGDWSLVSATLAGMRMGLALFADASHFYLVSGDCLPIQSAASVKAHLADSDRDIIESQDFFRSGWIKTGLREDRLIYRHPFNERSQRRLFYAALALQRRFGLARALPTGLQMRIGSQWFCLRRSTCEAILGFLARRRDVLRFFRTTWIPDESAIQTLVWHLVPEGQIDNRPPTFLMFTDYGMPVSFYNDHLDLLTGQTAFFARKISPFANKLREALHARWTDAEPQPHRQADARRLAHYVARRGRDGLRSAARAWDAPARPSSDMAVLIILSKKWSAGKRLASDVAQATQARSLGYFFDEQAQGDPDLGGMARDMARRHADPASLLRLLFDHYPTRRLILCLDPSRADLLESLHACLPDLTVLELQCKFSDAELSGHAQRLGLLRSEQDAAAAGLWPILRREFDAECSRLRDAQLPRHYCLKEGVAEEKLARTIAECLQVPHQQGQAMARRPGLFQD